jgi:hypothetical protein
MAVSTVEVRGTTSYRSAYDAARIEIVRSFTRMAGAKDPFWQRQHTSLFYKPQEAGSLATYPRGLHGLADQATYFDVDLERSLQDETELAVEIAARA